MNRFIHTIDSILSILAKFLVGILASGVIISVILRYVFSISFVWSEETLTMVFVATTFFGAALGIREKEHITITNFIHMIPEKARRVCIILAQVIIIGVSLFMIYYSFRIINKVGKVPSPATGIPKGVYYSIIPISFLITIFYSIVNILGEFIHIDEPVKGFLDDSEAGNQNTSTIGVE